MIQSGILEAWTRMDDGSSKAYLLKEIQELQCNLNICSTKACHSQRPALPSWGKNDWKPGNQMGGRDGSSGGSSSSRQNPMLILLPAAHKWFCMETQRVKCGGERPAVQPTEGEGWMDGMFVSLLFHDLQKTNHCKISLPAKKRAHFMWKFTWLIASPKCSGFLRVWFSRCIFCSDDFFFDKRGRFCFHGDAQNNFALKCDSLVPKTLFPLWILFFFESVCLFLSSPAPNIARLLVLVPAVQKHACLAAVPCWCCLREHQAKVPPRSSISLSFFASGESKQFRHEIW